MNRHHTPLSQAVTTSRRRSAAAAVPVDVSTSAAPIDLFPLPGRWADYPSWWDDDAIRAHYMARYNQPPARIIRHGASALTGPLPETEAADAPA